MATLLYITREQIKETLSMQSESFADNDIDAALVAASRTIDNTCSRRFYLDADATSVRTYSPRFWDRVTIDDFVAITTVKIDNNGDGVFEYTLTANRDYVVEPENAAADGWAYTTLVRHPLASYWFPRLYPRSVQVTAQFGWPAVPGPVVQATSILAYRYLSRARSAPFGVIAAGPALEGGHMRIWKTDPDVYELLKPYMRRKLLL